MPPAGYAWSQPLDHQGTSKRGFFFFWLPWVFVAVRGLSLGAVSEGLLFIVVHRFLIAVASLVVEHGL